MTYTKATSKTIKHADTVSTSILMALNTKDNGSMISSMDSESKFGLTAPSTKETIIMAESMALVATNGRMDQSSQATGTKTKFMDSELING